MSEEARFKAFVDATTPDERDWIAFVEFEQAVWEVSMTSTLANGYGEPELWAREHGALELPISAMLYRALPRVGLGAIVGNTAGLGNAIRYGLIEPTANDSITFRMQPACSAWRKWDARPSTHTRNAETRRFEKKRPRKE